MLTAQSVPHICPYNSVFSTEVIPAGTMLLEVSVIYRVNLLKLIMLAINPPIDFSIKIQLILKLTDWIVFLQDLLSLSLSSMLGSHISSQLLALSHTASGSRVRSDHTDLPAQVAPLCFQGAFCWQLFLLHYLSIHLGGNLLLGQ